MANEREINNMNDLIFQQELETLFKELEQNGDIDKYEAEIEKDSKEKKIKVKYEI